MADWRREARFSRCHFSLRGLHAPEGDVPVGKAWLHAVLYLLCVEKYERGSDQIFHGADADTGARVFSTEPVAQHTRYFERISAKGWPTGICGAIYSGCDAWGQLWRLRACLQTYRTAVLLFMP